MTALIIDTNIDVVDKLAQFKPRGVTHIGRYLNRLNPTGAKVIKPAEARAIAAAGMQLFLIYEAGGHPSGAEQGKLDGEWCRLYLPTIGTPHGAAIYNTVDYDAQAADIPGIVAYFAAFQNALDPLYRIGGYGSGYVLSQLTAMKVITLRWLACSRGFAGTREALGAGAYDMAQSLSPKIAGVDVDTNYLRVPDSDFGAFVPFAPVAEPKPQGDGWFSGFMRRLTG